MILSWTASNTADILEIAKGLTSDIAPLLFIILGIYIGMTVIYGIVGIIRRDKWGEDPY